jgi:hypothetical protein
VVETVHTPSISTQFVHTIPKFAFLPLSLSLFLFSPCKIKKKRKKGEGGMHREKSRIGDERSALQKLCKLANPRIANENVQSAKLPHRALHQLLPRLRLAHIACYLNQPACLWLIPFYLGSERYKGGDVVRVRGQVEVVDGDVAALPQELEGDCAADSCGAAGYGGGEAGEEGMGWHWRCCGFDLL